MLTLLIGKSKTGKSKYLMDSIEKCSNEGFDTILLVPSQMRMITEEKYLDYEDKDGIINVDITTISEFVSEYLEKNKIVSPKVISNIDKKIIMNKVIEENGDIFEIYKKSNNFSGFTSSMQIYMDLIKKSGITKDVINNLDSSKDYLTISKLKEIYNLYEAYLKEIDGKYIDSIDEIDIFLNSFKEKKEQIAKTKFFFDSYNNFTKSELAFISLLLRNGYDVVIEVTCDLLDLVENVDDIKDVNLCQNILNDIESTEDIFSEYNLTVVNLVKIAKSCESKIEVIPFINRKDNIFPYVAEKVFLDEKEKIKTNGKIKINFVTNMYSEVKHVAIDIKKKIKDGARFNDFAIFVSNLDEYNRAIKSTFDEYGIIYHIDLNTKIQLSLVYRYIYSLLQMMQKNITLSNLMSILKLGVNGISIEDISYFENYCLEFNIIDEYRLKSKITELAKDEYDIKRLNDIKNKATQPFFELKEKIKKEKNVDNIISYIYSHLENENILNALEEKTKAMEESEDAEIKYMAGINIVAFEKLKEVFESIKKIYTGHSVNISKFNEIFKSILSDIKVKSVPPTIDEVDVIDINVSKILPVKYVYILGVNEGKMPLDVSEDMFFSDRDLNILKSDYNVEIREDSFSKILLEKFNIYEAMCSALDELNVYYLGSDLSGKSMRKSEIINMIKDVTDVKENYLKDEDFEKYSNRDILETLGNQVRENQIDERIAGMYGYIIENDRFKENVEYIRKADKLSKTTLDKIYKSSNINSSISRLEAYKKCPFSYFVKYILNVDERKVYKVTSLDLGNFMHNVLEEFSKYLQSNGITWQEILINEEKYLLILNEIIEESLKNILGKHKENEKYDVLKRKLYNAMKRAVLTIAKSFNQSEFVPYAYELEFSNDSKYLPIEIKLSDDKKMLLRGKIDRVDVAKIESAMYARIIDYKSSEKNLEIDDVKEGISLQLITYMSAFIDSNKEEKINPAGVMYFNLADSFVHFKKYTDNEEDIKKGITESLRMKGIFLKDLKVMKAMDKKIEGNDRIVDVSTRSINSTSGSKSLLNEEEFNNICTEIKEILGKIGNELIIEGNVEIKPNKKKNPCDWCVYGPICRKNNMC